MAQNHIFTFLASSLKPPEDGTSCYARRFPKPRPSYFVKIMILQTNSPRVCVIKVCLNGGATCIIGEIITKDNWKHSKFNANL